jgi:hypothetical protein
LTSQYSVMQRMAVVRDGGRLLVIDPCFATPLRQVFNACLHVAPHAGDYRFYSIPRAKTLLADAGFEFLSARRVGLWAFLLVCCNRPFVRLDSAPE